MLPHIVYLHGFASAGEGSVKAGMLKGIFGERLLAPNLPDKPAEAVPFLGDFLAGLDGPAMLVGSSLGGYYATCYGGRFRWPVALINPLVDVTDMRAALGERQNCYTGANFILDENDIDTLAALDFAPGASPTLVLLDSGDELLDVDKAIRAYLDRAKLIIYPGGSHRFDHLEASAALLREHAAT